MAWSGSSLREKDEVPVSSGSGGLVFIRGSQFAVIDLSYLISTLSKFPPPSRTTYDQIITIVTVETMSGPGT
jgi:hypothetical protein